MKKIAIGCGVLLVLGTIAMVVILFAIIGAIKHAQIYKTSIERLKDDPRAVAALGEITGFGFFPSGSIEVSGTEGKADLSIKVKGENQDGILYVKAKKVLGRWEYTVFTLETESGNRIDLLTPQGAPPPAGPEAAGQQPGTTTSPGGFAFQGATSQPAQEEQPEGGFLLPGGNRLGR